MRMEVHTYCNVNVKSQAGNIRDKDIPTTQKGQSQKKISYGSLKSMHFARNFSRRPRVQESWCYVSIYENAPKKLPHLPRKSCHNFT